MNRHLRRLCYGIDGPEYERSAGVPLARAVLFGFFGIMHLLVAVTLVASLILGWNDPRFLAIVIAIGVLNIVPILLIHGFLHPAQLRHTMRHRRSNGGSR
jgi:ABC-type bacteriocin/lantibiotic exporter with double-glycine peptidase domain